MLEEKLLYNMMQINLVKWFLLFALIHVQEGFPMLWELNEFVPLERTVRTILKSCYDNDNAFSSILVLGDLYEFIEDSSVIRINTSEKSRFSSKIFSEQLNFGVSRVILVEDSPQKLYSDLKQLSEEHWWNHMTSSFIIAKYKGGCDDFKYFLSLSWSKSMINSIYICTRSMNTSVLYTWNSMTNYAPYPWERMEEVNDSNVFRQVFDRRVSCKNLHFDKTRHLNGYEIKVMGKAETNLCWHTRPENCKFYNRSGLELKPLQSIILALNGSGRFEDKIRLYHSWDCWRSENLDITSNLYTLQKIEKCYFLWSHIRAKVIGVVKSKRQVPQDYLRLHKILKLWSILVLIPIAIAVAFLLLILIRKNHDFVLAVLDVVRLLTYTSIRTNAQTHAFRIYFSTMLIFMVINNGIIQGKIAVFLTTREKASAIETVNELADSGYRMFAVGTKESWLNEKCPKCNFRPASPQECIEQVLNNTNYLCAIWEDQYYTSYSQSELDVIPGVLIEDFLVYGCREHWPLQNRFNDGLSRLFRTGILDYWERKLVDGPKRKRVAKEAEWSPAQYQPIKLHELKFALQALALGLSISTIVFIWELVQGNYETT